MDLENIEVVNKEQLPVKIILDVVFKDDEVKKLVIVFHEMINETFGNTTEAFMVPTLNESFFDGRMTLIKYCYTGHKTTFIGEIEIGDISNITKDEFIEVLQNISYENVLVFSEEQMFLTKKLLDNKIFKFNFKVY
jgi:hypothetical protein